MKESTCLKRIITIITSLTVLAIFFPLLRAEYIDPGEDKFIEVIKEKTGGSDYPPYIAYDISAEALAGEKGTIIIRWRSHPDFPGLFTVGRSKKAIENSDTALKAQKVGILKARGENYIIDRNLEEGNYYYVVLEKDRLVERNIDLYKDVNYTSSPVIISDQPVFAKPEYLSAGILGQKMIEIRWMIKTTGGKKSKVILYRSTSPLDSRDKLNKAKIILEDTYDSGFIDSNAIPGQNYYYAIDIEGQNPVDWLKNKNYTSNGIKIQGEKGASTVPAPEYAKEPEKVFNPEDTDDPVEAVLKEFFYRNKFDIAEEYLFRLLRKGTLSELDTVKAKLYMGRSHFEMKEYRKALRYLLEKDVQKAYPEESRFWADRCIEKLE